MVGAGIHLLPSPIIFYVTPDNLYTEKLCSLWTAIGVVTINQFLIKRHIFYPGPNALGSLKAWLAETPISSRIWAFKKAIFGVLNGP